MYSKLLISAGGGIISHDQQAEQENCATIAIGLGGTGISCLRTLKKEIYTRVKPDDPTSTVPKYRHVKFLAVDTDRSSLGDTGSIDTLDANTEFFNISCPDIGSLLSQAHILAQNTSLNWLKSKETPQDVGITILSAEAGAGGVRQIGRLLLLQNVKSFVAKLKSMITEARTDLSGNPGLNIHIFTGLAGGTGAGTFLDVCYLVQHALGELGLAGQACICGYFFMPDVNIANHPAEYLPINGFAAMKELDYCMNFDNNGGEWNQQYDGFSIRTSNPPVKLAHLITATDADGNIVANAYNFAMHVAVDYVLEYIIKPNASEDAEKASEGVFTIKSHISNVNKHIEMVDKKHGATYNYCILGASNAYLPYKEITTYLTSKIFEGFGDLPKQLPLDAAIDMFVKNNGLGYDDIIRELRDKVPTVPNIPVDHKLLYEQTEGITPDVIPHLFAPMRDAGTKVSGMLQTNKAALLNTGSVTSAGTAPKLSLIERVRSQLIAIASQADKGPYYSAAMLHNLNARDLRKLIVGYKKDNDEKIGLARADLQLRERTVESALSQLQNSGMLTRKRAAEDYTNAVRAYYVQRNKINELQVMGELLTEFEVQLTDLYNNFFAIFATIMQNLQATFEANRLALADPLTEDTGYAVKLMSIQDLQESLDATVAAMDIPGQIHEFVSSMLNNSESWISQDENKIVAAVSRYFLSQLSDYTNRTIDDYLRIKFDTTDPATLQRKVYEEIIIPLGGRATPLFWTEGGIYSLSDSASMGYISIPNVSDCIRAAAEQYVAAGTDVEVRPAWATDRISIFRFVCGVPMFGYKGVTNYKRNYINKTIIGSHLYEGSKRDARDNRVLINVSPISCIPAEMYTPEDVENLAMYEFALANGIITKTPLGSGFEYHLNSFDIDEVNECLTFARKILDAKNVQNATAFLANRNGKSFTIKSYRVIPIMQNNDYADLIARDHVLGSRENICTLKEQTAIIREYVAVIEQLNNLVNATSAMNKTVHDFAMGLMTGAIKKINDYEFSYCYETYGIEESVPLTTIDSAPYGMSLPLYSAYVGYCALDEDVKEKIAASVKENLLTNSEQVNACVAQVKQWMEKAGAMLAVAKQSFPADIADIDAFIKQFAGEVQTFAATR